MRHVYSFLKFSRPVSGDSLQSLGWKPLIMSLGETSRLWDSIASLFTGLGSRGSNWTLKTCFLGVALLCLSWHWCPGVWLNRSKINALSVQKHIFFYQAAEELWVGSRFSHTLKWTHVWFLPSINVRGTLVFQTMLLQLLVTLLHWAWWMDPTLSKLVLGLHGSKTQWNKCNFLLCICG